MQETFTPFPLGKTEMQNNTFYPSKSQDTITLSSQGDFPSLSTGTLVIARDPMYELWITKGFETFDLLAVLLTICVIVKYVCAMHLEEAKLRWIMDDDSDDDSEPRFPTSSEVSK